MRVGVEEASLVDALCKKKAEIKVLFVAHYINHWQRSNTNYLETY